MERALGADSRADTPRTDTFDRNAPPPNRHDAASDAADAAMGPEVNDSGLPTVPDTSMCITGGIVLDATTSLDGSDADAEETCEYFYTCGMPTSLIAIGCTLDQRLDDGAAAGQGGLSCHLVENEGCIADVYVPSEAGSITIRCSPSPGAGGRPSP